MEKVSSSPIHRLLIASAVLLGALGLTIMYSPAKKVEVHIKDGIGKNMTCQPLKDMPRLYECDVKLVFLLSDLVPNPIPNDPPPPPPPITPSSNTIRINYTF